MLAPRTDNRPYFVPLLLGLIVLAWITLWLWGESPFGRYLHHDELDRIQLGANASTAFVMAVFVGGWTLMITAMMLPTTLPLLTLFRRLVRNRKDAPLLITLVIAGYIAIWAGFGLLAHAGDAVLHAGVGQWHWLEHQTWALAGMTLTLAGVYQFTPLKYMCLDKCRSPMSFVTEHWTGSKERRESFKLGVHHGVFCVGCCWTLMLLMFVVGVGSIAWMLALGAIMAIEKNMPWGRRLSMPLGFGLVAAGIIVFLLSAPGVCAHDIGC